MAAVLKHWREASTLILVTARRPGTTVKPNFVSASDSGCRASAVKGANFEVLLLKRSSKSKFMPNLYVFPGGVASDIDFSSEWIAVFDLLGKDQRQQVFDFVQRGGQGAPMFSRPRDKQFSHIPSEVAFRITAIRETFEESGVLLVRRAKKGDNFWPHLWDGPNLADYCQLDETVINEWRERVDRDPADFLRMCQELQLVPDVWSLYEWSNWLTPLMTKHRFDTAFFICCVDGKPHVAEDEGETVHSQWSSPYDVLALCNEAQIAVPQQYELSRLLHFDTAPELTHFAWQRAQHRVERWLAVRVACADAVLSVLPGDSLYPERINPEGPPPDITYEETVASLMVSHPNTNRSQFFMDRRRADGGLLAQVVCNIRQPGGHVSPVPTDTFTALLHGQPQPKL
ncbi:hypothetical protein BaRGS_00026503 [Batillaria attramentaria]|uniref:Nudix hydrolase domain-containing protein n=1 Tax=Batillaria attramentaria TaxID=370345 RepID=A0ABD0K5P7_9CAEN